LKLIEGKFYFKINNDRTFLFVIKKLKIRLFLVLILRKYMIECIAVLHIMGGSI